MRSVFSPDGKLIASTCNQWRADGKATLTLKIWNFPKIELLQTIDLNKNEVSDALTFSPDGRFLLNGITIRDAETGAFRSDLDLQSTRFSLSGNRIVLVAKEGIELRDFPANVKKLELEGHPGKIFDIKYSPDGNLIAASSNHTIKLWNANTGYELLTLQGHSWLVSSISFSPDNTLLASGSMDKTVKVWDVSSGKELRTLTGHSAWVTAVAFSPDGSLLASGSEDNSLRLWNPRTGEEIVEVPGHPGWITGLQFSPDGNAILTTADVGLSYQCIKLWNTKELIQNSRKQNFSEAFRLLDSEEPSQKAVDDIHPKRKIYTSKIVMMGQQAVGKTSILLRYSKSTFIENYKPTLGADFVIREVAEANFHFYIWDLAGHPSFSILRGYYMHGSNGGIIVVDITNKQTLEEAKCWYSDLRASCRRASPVVIAVNKCDAVRMDLELISQVTSSLSWAQDFEIPIVFCSAKTGEGLDNAFSILLRRLFSKDKATVEGDAFIKKFLASRIPVDKSGFYDVFISYNTADIEHAKRVYQFLNMEGFSVFFASESIPSVGQTDYRRLIDNAIEHTTHMIIVGSTRENVESKWVEAEWGMFINEIRAGRKSGNILTLIAGNLSIEQLPISLRGYEVVRLDDNGLQLAKSFLWRTHQ
nr:GTP-binding protein [Candidatus Sigynarchaeota archaeon]